MLSVQEDFRDLESQLLPALANLTRAQVRHSALACRGGGGGRPLGRNLLAATRRKVRCLLSPLRDVQSMAAAAQQMFLQYSTPELVAADWDRFLLQVRRQRAPVAPPHVSQCMGVLTCVPWLLCCRGCAARCIPSSAQPK